MTGFFVSRRYFDIIHGRPFIQGHFFIVVYITVYKKYYSDNKKGNKNVKSHKINNYNKQKKKLAKDGFEPKKMGLQVTNKNYCSA